MEICEGVQNFHSLQPRSLGMAKRFNALQSGLGIKFFDYIISQFTPTLKSVLSNLKIELENTRRSQNLLTLDICGDTATHQN